MRERRKENKQQAGRQAGWLAGWLAGWRSRMVAGFFLFASQSSCGLSSLSKLFPYLPPSLISFFFATVSSASFPLSSSNNPRLWANGESNCCGRERAQEEDQKIRRSSESTSEGTGTFSALSCASHSPVFCSTPLGLLVDSPFFATLFNPYHTLEDILLGRSLYLSRRLARRKQTRRMEQSQNAWSSIRKWKARKFSFIRLKIQARFAPNNRLWHTPTWTSCSQNRRSLTKSVDIGIDSFSELGRLTQRKSDAQRVARILRERTTRQKGKLGALSTIRGLDEIQSILRIHDIAEKQGPSGQRNFSRSASASKRVLIINVRSEKLGRAAAQPREKFSGFKG